MKKLTLFFIFVFFTLGCSTLKDTTVQKTNEDIQLSMFKYLLEDGKKEKKTKSKLSLSVKLYYFLSNQGKDPSNDIMDKLNNQNLGHKVYPKSQSKFQHGELVINVLNEKQQILRQLKLSGVLTHKKLGGLGVSARLGKIKWINKTKVTLPWSFFRTSLDGTANIATLELKKGKWVVINTKRTAVS